MTKLYEIEQEIELALDKYYSSFDEDWLVIDEELFNTSKKELEELQNKKDDFTKWILQKRQNTIWETQMLKLEIARLQELLESKEKEIIKSENFIQFFFKDKLKKPLVFENWKLWFRKSKAVVLWENFANDKYKVEKISYSYDKKAIKEDLEKWEVIEWAFIEERENFYIK